MSSPAEHMSAAIDAAVESVRTGGGPFGAVIVTADGRKFMGMNRVTVDNDPTAHAEVTAIRLACKRLGTYDLSGAVLYSSCEPCPMCATAARWARVRRVEFAADRYDAAAAGFDDSRFYDVIVTPDDLIAQAEHAERLRPFDTWAQTTTRTDY